MEASHGVPGVKSRLAACPENIYPLQTPPTTTTKKKESFLSSMFRIFIEPYSPKTEAVYLANELESENSGRWLLLGCHALRPNSSGKTCPLSRACQSHLCHVLLGREKMPVGSHLGLLSGLCLFLAADDAQS